MSTQCHVHTYVVRMYSLKKVRTHIDRTSLPISGYDHMLKGILALAYIQPMGVLYYVPYATTLCFMQGNTCVDPDYIVL